MKGYCVALLVALFHAAPAVAQMSEEEMIARGEYLVATSGCNDCHTPWKMGANGPEPDMELMLSGHPESLPVTEVPEFSEPWVALTYATNTAIAGPWGVSFTANLTPDPETGASGSCTLLRIAGMVPR